MNEKYDLGILGWWYGQNYGSMLTYYALNTVIKNLGLKPIMIHESLGFNGYRVKWADDIPPMQFARRQKYDYTEQQHLSKNHELNQLTDTFMVGSDQLWNPLIGRVNDDLFLNFTEDNKRRISYATSFGNANDGKYNPDFLTKNIPNLRRFDSVSVREKYAVETAQSVFGIEAEQVLDPVFLIDQNEYSKLAEGATTCPKGDYLLSFILDPTPEKKAVIINIAKKLRLAKIVILTDADLKSVKKAQDLFTEDLFEVISEIKPENWLYAYKNSKYVITDSFHGSCFSFIFQKPFSAFFNMKRGADRFTNLMNLFEFGNDRRIYENHSAEDIEKNKRISFKINYSSGNSKVATESKRSYEWLKNALTISKQKVKILPAGDRFPTLRWFLLQNPFNFYQENMPTPLNRKVQFKDNGTLSNSPTGIKFWAIIEGKLTLYDENKKLVSTFNTEELVKKIPANIRILEETAGTKKFKYVIKLSATASTPSKAGAEKTDIAIPNNTPTREQIVLNVLNDSKISNLKEEILSEIPELNVSIGRELKEYTHNKVGGPADIIAYPKNINDVSSLVSFAIKNDVPYTVLGKGSNVIVRDGGIRGVVIMLTELDYFKIDKNLFIAGAGSGLIEATYYLLEHSKSNLEWACGIPGTIGGAVFMNAGTNVSDIRSSIKEVKYLNHNGELKVIAKEDISWGVRYTTFQEHKNWIILEATFNVKEGSKDEMAKKMLATVKIRENHFPLENPNHGSSFKWWRAPRLIKQAGLAGYQIGGVKISEKQPGFFVNVNQATASDYEALIAYTIAKVYEFSGFLLEPEVEIIGERPHRYECYGVLAKVKL